MPAVLLSLDPGVNNFAYCVSRVTDAGDYTVLQHGMLHTTMRSLTSVGVLAAERRAYTTQLHKLLSTHRVTHVIAERYMLRRGSGGTAIEAINMMLGILFLCRCPVKIIPASQWKNDVRRAGVDLDALYVEGKAAAGLTPHQIDAAHIGVYAVGHLCSVSPPYSHVLYQLCSLPSTHLGRPFKPERKKRKKRACS
jgi:hypothetical protein